MKKDAANEVRDKLFNFRPALFAAIFLALGIVFAYFRLLKGASYLWLLCGLPIAICAICFCDREVLFSRCIVFLLLSCFFLVGFNGFRRQLYDHVDFPVYQGEVLVTGRVEKRKENGGNTRLVLGKFTVDGDACKGVLNAYLPTSFAKDIGISDRVVLRGEITTDTRVTASYGLRASDIHNQVVYRLVCKERGNKVGRSNNLFLRIRSRMEKALYRGMDESSAALSLGLLTGDMTGVEEDLVENMRAGGISHIFAVSGLNVGALYAFCLLLFHKTSLRRAPKPLRFLLIAGGLFSYAGVCGFSASVVRATLFCILSYALRLLGTSSDLLDALGASAVCILLFSPCQLFDVGFQLTFSACAGLALLTKPIGQVCDEVACIYRKFFPKVRTEAEEKRLAVGDILPPTLGEKTYRWVRDLLSATLAAQIATAPLLLWYFSFLSGWALLLNVFFVPIIDAGFTLLLLLVSIACCLPLAFSGVLLYIPSVCWSALMLLFEAVDFSSFALRNVRLSVGACLLYYWGLTLLSDKWNLSKGIKRGLTVLLFGGCLALLFLLNCL